MKQQSVKVAPQEQERDENIVFAATGKTTEELTQLGKHWTISKDYFGDGSFRLTVTVIPKK